MRRTGLVRTLLAEQGSVALGIGTAWQWQGCGNLLQRDRSGSVRRRLWLQQGTMVEQWAKKNGGIAVTAAVVPRYNGYAREREGERGKKPRARMNGALPCIEWHACICNGRTFCPASAMAHGHVTRRWRCGMENRPGVVSRWQDGRAKMTMASCSSSSRCLFFFSIFVAAPRFTRVCPIFLHGCRRRKHKYSLVASALAAFSVFAADDSGSGCLT